MPFTYALLLTVLSIIDPVDDDGSDNGGTIGARLRRKRRVTAASPLEEKSPNSKRPRNTVTPPSKRASPAASRSSPTARKQRTQASSTKLQVVKGGDGDAEISESDTISQHSDTAMTGADGPKRLRDLSLREQFMQILPKNPTSKLSGKEAEATVQKIIDYCEKVEGLKKLGQDYGNGIDTDGLPTMGADTALKAEALPVLDNLSVQILHMFATTSVTDLNWIISHPDSDPGVVSCTCTLHLN